ncbi:hypothetical protein PC128_g18974 [Phytophthora cactorum]|nr:hypothetical protein PC128_g18974 [Phytophthora cactorum]
MRFYYAISQTAQEFVASTQIHSDVKRSLRSHQYEYEEEKDSVDPLNDTEERGNGVNYGSLNKLVRAHDTPLKIDLAVLGTTKRKWILKVLKSQDLSQQQLRKKLGRKNSAYFQAWKENFHTGNLPKKHPEDVF